MNALVKFLDIGAFMSQYDISDIPLSGTRLGPSARQCTVAGYTDGNAWVRAHVGVSFDDSVSPTSFRVSRIVISVNNIAGYFECFIRGGEIEVVHLKKDPYVR